MHRGIALAALVAAAVCTGCQVDAGTSRPLGNVSYDEAFAVSRQVLAQHYSIESADAAAGTITSRPRLLDAPPSDRVLGTVSPARQIARMKIRRDKDQVVAHLAIEQQRQASAAFRQQRAQDLSYDELPHRTPADIDAATTPQQNQAWQTEKYMHDFELRILDEIARRLNVDRLTSPPDAAGD